MQIKRHPTLADLFVYGKGQHNYVTPENVDKIKNLVRGAPKFVIDSQAVQHIARTIVHAPETIIRDQQFARPPYEVAWIEYDQRVLDRTLLQEYKDSDQLDDVVVPKGHLFHHGYVYNFLGDYEVGSAVLMSQAYVLNIPWPIQLQDQFIDAVHQERDLEKVLSKIQPRPEVDSDTTRRVVKREMLDNFLWGYTFVDFMKPALDGQIASKEGQMDLLNKAHALRDKHTAFLLPVRNGMDPVRVGQATYSQSRGELRNIITMLLLLNEPSVAQYLAETPKYKTFHRGKSTSYFAHTVVTINLEQAREYIRTNGFGSQKRRHQVRGHYCLNFDAHEYEKIGCVHNWQVDFHRDDDPDNPNHWVCATCGGKRWWRHEHVRGDATIGYVQKTYNVR